MPQVRIENPTIGLPNRFWSRRVKCFDLDQVNEEPFEQRLCIGPGRIKRARGPEVFAINIKKGIDERFGEVVTLCDTLINQECIEVAAHAKNLSAPIVRISFGLEVSGEAVDVRPQWPASEVDERSSLFEPVL